MLIRFDSMEKNRTSVAENTKRFSLLHMKREFVRWMWSFFAAKISRDITNESSGSLRTGYYPRFRVLGSITEPLECFYGIALRAFGR